MHMNVSKIAIALIVASLALVSVSVITGAWQDIAYWALDQQRTLQSDMAAGIQAVRDGAPAAWLALMAAAGTYGFVHAVGPGHGKFLIGGIGLGVQISAMRLAIVAIASSLVQAIWAIVLVYGGFVVFERVAANIAGWSEAYLATVSYAAIGGVGSLIAWRGLKAFLARSPKHTHDMSDHDHAPCGCGGHGPSASDIARMTSFRATVMVILSIAVRPCTGALFLLIIAWQMDIAAAGAAAVMVMGLGTAAMTALVAVSSVVARTATYAASNNLGVLTLAVPSLQLTSGVLIIWFAASLLMLTIN